MADTTRSARGPHEVDEWVPLREYMELRVQLAEAATHAAESRSELKFAQLAHASELTRLADNARFSEHNTALEQMGKMATTAALAQKEQAGQFAVKTTVEAEIRALAKQVEDLKLSRQELVGTSKGGEDLRRIGMMIVAAIVAGIGALLFAGVKLGGA